MPIVYRSIVTELLQKDYKNITDKNIFEILRNFKDMTADKMTIEEYYKCRPWAKK